MFFSDESIESIVAFPGSDDIFALELRKSNPSHQNDIEPVHVNQVQTIVQKTHPIQKKKKSQSTKGKKTSKRYKQQEINIMGRPQNFPIERQHLKISQSYNDIIYHYARLLIFLKLKAKKEQLNPLICHSEEDDRVRSQTLSLISMQIFPELDNRSSIFLLHPKSLHFVFQYQRKHNQKKVYLSQEIKIMFLTILSDKNLLTQSTQSYISDYWPDIIELTNNSNQENYENRQFHEESLPSEKNQDDISNEQQQINVPISLNIAQSTNNKSSPSKRKDKSKKHNELDQMRRQLTEDDSIAAYEIACYLHACRVKFRLTFQDS